MDNGPGQRYGLLGVAEIEETDLICMPDLPWFIQRGLWTAKDMETVQQMAVAICETKQDRFCILDLPPETTPTGAMVWRRLFDTSYAGFYYPYLVPMGGHRQVPPCGHVAGVFARCDHEFGVYRAPANEPFEGVVDLALILQQGDLATLNSEGINCLQVFAQRGIRVWGARTATGDPQLRHISVRRTILAIGRALNVGLQWVVFE
ncbi:MAG: phage tail sheath family protein, partial [Betaproteobacteria bacterium]|nr:phage tail sheath family protein [Betaproteobacteria bacterium]